MKNSFYLILVIFVVVLTLDSCKKKIDVPNPIIDKPDDFNVRDVKLTITYTKSPLSTLPVGFQDTVNKVQDLLAKVFSSKDFRDELYKRNFADSAYSNTSSPCFNKVYGGTVVGSRISGKAVYDNLLPSNVFTIPVYIQKAASTGTLGFAYICNPKITTNDYWLTTGNKGLSHSLVRHWAHEYTHTRGYVHGKWGNSSNIDPAYGVANVVRVVMDKWIASGIIK